MGAETKTGRQPSPCGGRGSPEIPGAPRFRLKIILIAALSIMAGGLCLGQWYVRGPWPPINDTSDGHTHMVQTEGRDVVDETIVRTARETASHSTSAPIWTNAPEFIHDVWTFARIKYKYANGPNISYSSSPWGWITDYPDSDLNLSFRVQQMTSIKADADGRTLYLTDPDLFDYPWIYMVEPGRMTLRDEDVPMLRKYLLNGGVLMGDDFWGQKQWDNFEREIKRALPETEYHFEELDMSHPIFHCVFDIKVPKNKLQTPNSHQAADSLRPGNPFYGITWEFYHDDYHNDGHGAGAHDMHVRAILDKKGRIMVIATHNCDNGDGWEREGEDDAFFHEFSEKRAFPLGINMIFYLMTH